MSLTRRRFIAGGIVASGSVIAAGMNGMPLWAQAPPRRRSLLGMALNDPILSAWREGVGKLIALPAADTFNWTKLSTIHGTPAGFNKCPHGNWYFLPWHRAYITMYERKVREITKFPGFALPYWDWTLQPTMPPAFSAATYQGKPNPLFLPGRTLTGAIPPAVTGSAVITQALMENPFERFGTSRPQGQNSLAQTWVTNRSGVQGTLEATPHNLVHNRVGGVMPSTRSPIDPLFMMHHGNIDRLWAVWNASGFANSADPLWTGMPFTANFFNADGSVWSPKVSELLNCEALGYTYGLASDALQTATPQSTRMERLFTQAAGVDAPGVTSVRVANTAEATATRPLAIPIRIAPASLRLLAGRGARAAGEDRLVATRQRDAEAALPRVVAVIRSVVVTNQQTTEVRVFLNAVDLSQTTPATSASYVGTFGFFGGNVHAGHTAEAPSVMVDLTEAIGRLVADGGSMPEQWTVQLLPAPGAGGTVATTGTAKPAAIEVTVVAP